MAYASPLKVANGLVLDFTVDNADTAVDTFLGLNASGEVTKFSSIPRARVSGGGNLTEATSSVLSITGGTAAVLTSGLTIQVLQAGAAQSGYLSTTDWNTFNNKLGTSLTSAYVFVGNGSNVATGVAITGDIGITNAGVTSITAGAIVNADVNASAAIAVSKLAAVTASRVLGSDGSGFIQALDIATYPSLAELSYVKGVTSSLQTQMNTKLTVTLTAPSTGEVITYNGANWVNSAAGTGVPAAGTTNQILRKIDNTNYNTEWHTLVVADLTDLASTVAELNKLSGVTTSAAQFNFSNTLVGNIQDQLNSKRGIALTRNALWVGDASNLSSELAPGANGYVLTSVSGVPTWSSPIGGSTGATDNAILRADGTGGSTLQASAVFIGDTGNIDIGTDAGTLRNIQSAGSGSNVGLQLLSKGTGVIAFSTAATTLNVSGSSGSLAFSNQTASTITGSNGTTSNPGYDLIVKAGNANSGDGTPRAGGHLYLSYGVKNTTGPDGNIGFQATTLADWQDMERGFYEANVLTAPTDNPASGLFRWVSSEPEGSNMKIRTSGGHFAKPILQRKVTVAGGATLRGIGSTPVEIIPAPGANKFIHVSSISVSYNYNLAVYNFGVGSNPTFQFTGGGIVAFISAAQINGAADFNIKLNDATGVTTVGGAISPTNTALQLGTQDSGNASTGDGDIDVVVYYWIEDQNT